MSNQFFFDKLLIDAQDDTTTVAGAELREPWATVLNSNFERHMAANTKNPGHLR